MCKLEDMKIYLLDRNIETCGAWNKYFLSVPNVEVVCLDFLAFMRQYKVDCVVSPANGYGLMDGGYDQAITDWFGPDLQKSVQQYIIDNLYGEQPVGSSIMLETDINSIKLIHTPTMRYPGIIKDDMVIYHCMRSCLIAALSGGVKSVVIPAFGGATGCVDYDTVAKRMWQAYKQLSVPPSVIDWDYAVDQRIE